MRLDYQNVEHVKDLTLEELCVELRELTGTISTMQQTKWWLERSIAEQMEDLGARMVRHDDGVTRLSYDVAYDYATLAQLREITDPEELTGIYTPPGEKMVQTPEKWNMTKGRSLANLGGEHRDIIERARKVQKDRPSIKFYEKDERSTR